MLNLTPTPSIYYTVARPPIICESTLTDPVFLGAEIDHTQPDGRIQKQLVASAEAQDTVPEGLGGPYA